MQTNTEHIEIPLNKQKLIILLISAIALLGVGIWFVMKPESFKNGLLGNPTIVSAIGMLSILVFGLSAIMVVKKIIDKRPGLLIDQTGITDNSTGMAAGHIPWKDIKEIKTSKVLNQKFLTIVLNSPQNDSAVSISVTTLKYDFNALETLLKQELEKHKGV